MNSFGHRKRKESVKLSAANKKCSIKQHKEDYKQIKSSVLTKMILVSNLIPSMSRLVGKAVKSSFRSCSIPG